MQTPKPHSQLIKDWSDGWEIQVDINGQWVNTHLPVFDPRLNYRRKPCELKATIIDGVLRLDEEEGFILDLRFLAKSLRIQGHSPLASCVDSLIRE